MVASQAPSSATTLCRAHHRLKAKSFQNMVTYKKAKRGSITPSSHCTTLGVWLFPCVQGSRLRSKKASAKGGGKENFKLNCAICYILRSFWSFIYWFELLWGHFLWFSEVLTRTWNLRWRIQDGRHFGDNDVLPTSCDVIRSCYELQKKDFWTCCRSFVVVA